MSESSLSQHKQQHFNNYVHHGIKEGALIFLVALCVYMLIALVSYNPNDPGWATTGTDGVASNYGGRTGAWFADVLIYFFGYISYCFPALLAFRAWKMFRHRKSELPFHWPLFLLRGLGLVLILLSATAFLALYSVAGLGADAGGKVGDLMAMFLMKNFNLVGTTLILVSFFLFGVTVFTGLSWLRLMDWLGAMSLKGAALCVAGWNKLVKKRSVTRDIVPTLHTPVAAVSGDVRPNEYIHANAAEKLNAAREADKPTLIEKLQQKLKSSGKGSETGQTTASKPSKPAPVASQSSPEPRVESKPDKSIVGKLKEVSARKSAKKAKAGCEDDIEIKPFEKKQKTSTRAVKETQGSLFDDSEGPLPSIAILDPPDPHKTSGFSPEYLKSLSHLLEAKLKDFGVVAEVVAVNPGPVITRFEIQPAPGVKVAKISNLAKDLARSLAVLSVRVVEVIRGKSVIGIEIPNEVREVVRFSEVLYSDDYEKSESPTTLALGNDIAGNAVITNLAKMPHVLVAGTTGSGKSVGINAMILSILFKATPDEVRFLMVDPKMLELSIYEGIPHLLSPVVTDMKEAANGLRWCVAEMERRYKLMAHMGVRNIAGFNRKVKDAQKAGEPLRDPLWQPDEFLDNAESDRPELETLPFIVVVIDEFADMMMIVGKKVEELIARIAQKARAAGIHLVLATQRPSVDVITGLIKANIPTRISFLVSSKVDSRTIIDQGGAEQLLGHGDMLYLPPGTSLPERVHGAFVSDDEVHRVVEAWKQRGEPEYIDDVLEGGDSDAVPGIPSEGSGDGSEDSDPLYDEAVAFVTESRRASISAVQRKLKIGYNRAANLVESMESAGVVSPAGHNGAREVLAPPPPKG